MEKHLEKALEKMTSSLSTEQRGSRLSDALSKIRKVLEKRPEVLAAYLYGSHAKGYAREGSDIDIGVLLYPNVKYSLMDEGGLKMELDCVNGFDVDAFIINGKSPSFKHSVISPRRVIFCQDDSLRADFEVQTFNEYFEVRPLLEESYQATLETVRRRLNVRCN